MLEWIAAKVAFLQVLESSYLPPAIAEGSRSMRNRILGFAGILLLIVFPVTGRAQLSLPLAGTQNLDWFLVNYVDHDTAGAASDFHCSWQSYHDHLGTDFVLRDFRQSDSGVYAFAAADGEVVSTIDTAFDRSKQEITGGYGNYVTLKHADSLFTIYAHLRKHGVLVKAGDQVKRGDQLGYVAASGRASDPHLHFEVYKNGLMVDPFGDACRGTGASSLFAKSPVYDSSYLLISSGLMGIIPAIDSLREHPAARSTFLLGRDSVIAFWAHGLSEKKGDQYSVTWTTPAGAIWYTYTTTADTNLRYWYWWSYIDGPAKQPTMPTGLWTVTFSNLTDLVSIPLTTQFEVSVPLEVKSINQAVGGLSPNPADSYFTVTDGTMEEAWLISSVGQRRQAMVEAGNRIVVRELPNGVYLLKFKSKNRWHSERLVVMH